ncbi:N-substituted formamide deformylase precursor [Microbacterium azadirachtae]|uniref:N-substituted formamide deformylase n=1 Tax=Microbacterium azadirachtae TaxID=582680 RepID=A0A0F0L1M9_9MICO|nr:amidohydrolase [Microbacterium azadirachtae]KJL26594.1 N-substituted formamide deformylase precursor [Microbacterium azadirachtae]
MSETADLIITGGRIFDGRVRTSDTAVAVRGNKIVRIGTDTEMFELRGQDTRVLDAAGGLIHPGFVDAHIHAASAGAERLSIDLTPATTVDETLDLIRAAAERSDAEWLTGGGWSHDLFPLPTRHQLDAIESDRPVVLSDAGHHTLWVNSRALDIAGLDRHTPDPHNGMIYRDDDGDPIGYLNETATELVGRFVPPASTEEIHAGILNAQGYLWSLGVTGWHEAILGDYNSQADCTPGYVRAIADGTLRSDVSGALWIPPGLTAPDVPKLVARFAELRRRNAAAGFATSTAKAMIDGVPHGGTAALLEPYCNHSHDGSTGGLHFTEDAVRAFVTQLDAAGFALHLHVMGDRGIRVALDAIEEARATNGTGPRHHIAHLSMVHPQDARRFGPLGVTANIQGLWAAPDAFAATMIGEERMLQGYPFRTMADAGADLAMGSDWPVSSADPWLAIHVTVNRWSPEPIPESSGERAGSVDTLDAEHQSLTLTQALGAYTSGSTSLVLGRPGRVQVGERADLAVATTDPFGLEPSAIATVRNAATVVRGELVFVRE